ncbi:MAG: M2 family metallopeptidase [Planctomycetaceae bacterium]|nr:M2 family metallopeptidase [Planctomycetaceae bacterium]
MTATTEAQTRFFFQNRLRSKATTPSQPSKPKTMNEEAVKLKVFLDLYQAEVFELFKRSSYAEWDAMTTGKEEAFKRSADAKLALAEYHSDKTQYNMIKELRGRAVGLTEIDQRAAERMELQYAQNQLPPELLKKMLEMLSEIEKTFQNHRPQLDGREYTNNDLLEMLEKETDSGKRQKIWETLKQIGEEVDDHVIALAKVRNEAAQQLGFKNYWEMQIVFQDYKPDELLAIFDELEKTTAPIFTEMKKELDNELAVKFGIPSDQLMPWHYDNPFFQQAPPSKEVDPNLFYKNKTKEEIIAIAVKYYKHLGLPYEEVLKRSDMFERTGKNQHAFSIDMDTLGDVRNLCNVKPTAEWMDTVLHEGGHGVYSLNCDQSLPFNLRDSAHIFTTEGIAMMFGAKARTPQWMIRFADADSKTVNAVADALRKQRQREQLIFCRWTIVMLNFEKALYENPDADLKTLWWEMVTRYQLLKRPDGRYAGDWASKPHFVIAPVYYHNYMLGELFAAQLRQVLGKAFINDDPKIGKILTDKVFFPGAKYTWSKFVEQATGQPLSPKAFSNELLQ